MYRKYIEERMEGMLDLLSESTIVEGKLIDRMKNNMKAVKFMKAVDVEVSWGGGKKISCAILDINNDNKMIDSIELDTPADFLNPDANENDVSDEKLLAFARKQVKKHFVKKMKTFRINNIYLH